MNIEVSNNWKFRLNIKKHLSNNNSREEAVRLSAVFKLEIQRLRKQLDKSNVREDEKMCFDEDLEQVEDNFDFIIYLAKNIPESEWHDYSFEGDFTKELNGVLSMLYDIADKRIITKNNVSEKFLWIG